MYFSICSGFGASFFCHTRFDAMIRLPADLTWVWTAFRLNNQCGGFQVMPTPHSFVVSFNEELQQFEMCSLKDSDLTPLRENAVVAPWRLDAIPGGELTENVANRLGACALGILSIYHPGLKERLRVKPDQFPLP